MRFRTWEVSVMFDEKDIILEARHVTRRFPASGGRELTACQDINLKFYRGKTLGLIQSFAHQIAVMYLGNIVEVLPAENLDKNAAHPYTKALMGAIFDVNMDFSKKIESIDSEAPSPLNVPPGCPFQDRCGRCMEVCRRVRPALTKLGPGRN